HDAGRGRDADANGRPNGERKVYAAFAGDALDGLDILLDANGHPRITKLGKGSQRIWGERPVEKTLVLNVVIRLFNIWAREVRARIRSCLRNLHRELHVYGFIAGERFGAFRRFRGS